VGFVVAFGVAAEVMPMQPTWVFLLVAIVAGILGAWLAVAVQWLAIGVGGFFAGGYLAVMILDLLGMPFGGQEWLIFLIGGVVGALLLTGLFNPVLIVLSSLVGAFMVTDALPLSPGMATGVFVVSLVVGIIFQARLLSGDERKDS
jgi:hypothetical protein